MFKVLRSMAHSQPRFIALNRDGLKVFVEKNVCEFGGSISLILLFLLLTQS